MSKPSHFIVDMDGVIYREGEPLDGSVELSNFLNENYNLTFLTNNSSKTPAEYVDKLDSLGIQVNKDQIMTSGKATALYLENDVDKDKKNCFVIGGLGLVEQIKEAGWDVYSDKKMRSDWEDVEVVVVGWDKHFNFEKMKYATLAIRDGADFIGTNPDNTYPSKEGIIPGAGAIISSIETASEVNPTIIGKPNPWMFEEMKIKNKEKTIIIGDRLDTDIKFGKNIGIFTGLVLSGISKKEDLKEISKSNRPDFVFDNAKELYEKLRKDEVVL